MKQVLCLSILAALVISLTMGVVALEDGKSEAKPFEPVAPLEVIMGSVDDYFADFEDNIKDRKFRSLKNDAQVLAELFNVISYHKKETDWQKWSEDNLAQFQKFTEASGKKDTGALESGFKRINATCDACHEKYRDA